MLSRETAELQAVGRARDHDFDALLGRLSDRHRRIEQFLCVLLRVARSRAHGAIPSDAARGARRRFAHAAPGRTADGEERSSRRMKAAANAEGWARDAIERLAGDHGRADPLHKRIDALIDDRARGGSPPFERAARARLAP